MPATRSSDLAFYSAGTLACKWFQEAIFNNRELPTLRCFKSRYFQRLCLSAAAEEAPSLSEAS